MSQQIQGVAKLFASVDGQKILCYTVIIKKDGVVFAHVHPDEWLYMFWVHVFLTTSKQLPVSKGISLLQCKYHSMIICLYLFY